MHPQSFRSGNPQLIRFRIQFQVKYIQVLGKIHRTCRRQLFPLVILLAQNFFGNLRISRSLGNFVFHNAQAATGRIQSLSLFAIGKAADGVVHGVFDGLCRRGNIYRSRNRTGLFQGEEPSGFRKMVLFVQSEHGEHRSQVARHFHRESPAFRKLVRIGLVMHGGKLIVHRFHLGLACRNLAGGIQVQVQEGDPLVYLTAGIHPELPGRRPGSYTYRPVAKKGLPFGKGNTCPAQKQGHSRCKFTGHFPIQKKHSCRAPTACRFHLPQAGPCT